MTKKLLALLLCLILAGNFALLVSAETAFVIDQAGLLDEFETQSLTEMADRIHADYGMDAVVLTVESLDGLDAQTYADNYYDQNGYSDDGVLMLLAMAEREYYITTSGEAIYALTDYALYQMEEAFIGDLSDGDYYDAFYSYLWDVNFYVEEYRNGGAVDGYIPEEDRYYGHTDVVYGEEESYEELAGTVWLISAGIGLVVAGVALLIMRSGMNTKVKQHAACDYIKNGSFNLSRSQDLFMYSQVSKRRKPQNNNSGGGGGSGVHRSSSGRSHGGRGGKF